MRLLDSAHFWLELDRLHNAREDSLTSYALNFVLRSDYLSNLGLIVAFVIYRWIMHSEACSQLLALILVVNAAFLRLPRLAAILSEQVKCLFLFLFRCFNSWFFEFLFLFGQLGVEFLALQL